MRHADAAMYAAKELGRNRIEVFDDTLRANVRRRLQNEIELRHAIEHRRAGGLLPARGRGAVGPAARRRGPGPVAAPDPGPAGRGGVHRPGRGDRASSSTSASWVLREACRQQVAWQRRHPDEPLLVRVNLSARQIGAAGSALPGGRRSCGRPASSRPNLCLEITETTVMADAAPSLEVLEKLRGLGVELAIDDFGTGYSSLSYLKRFPVDVLKIDRSFVDGLGADPDDTAIVQAIMVLASTLGLRVTAEGVETETQLEELLRLGCSRVQGYLFARPESVDDFTDRLGGAALRPVPTPTPDGIGWPTTAEPSTGRPVNLLVDRPSASGRR